MSHAIWEQVKECPEVIEAIQQKINETEVGEGDWTLYDLDTSENSLLPYLFACTIDVTRVDGEYLVYPCFFGETLVDLDPLRLKKIVINQSTNEAYKSNKVYLEKQIENAESNLAILEEALYQLKVREIEYGTSNN
jgi:hypothetical protein